MFDTYRNVHWINKRACIYWTGVLRIAQTATCPLTKTAPIHEQICRFYRLSCPLLINGANPKLCKFLQDLARDMVLIDRFRPMHPSLGIGLSHQIYRICLCLAAFDRPLSRATSTRQTYPDINEVLGHQLYTTPTIWREFCLTNLWYTGKLESYWITILRDTLGRFVMARCSVHVIGLLQPSARFYTSIYLL